jgi:alpha-galactosidase/6-phospho-beta-glucosidase family protein
MAHKITLVGGGSYGWGPAVIGQLLTHPYLAGWRVVLHDLDPEPLELVYRLGQRWRAQLGSPSGLERTTDLAAALDDAGFVVVTISTGGLRAMGADLEVPERFGVFQTVGDTVGPGGVSRTLRNAPVFLGLARAMERHCPQAWMLNASNPLSALTRAVNKETGIRALGLCHGVRGVARQFAGFFGVSPDQCAYTNAGIDHCAWFTDFVVDGRPAADLLAERGLEAWLRLPPGQAERDPRFGSLYSLRCGLALGRQLGALPAIGDRHLVEFFPGYLHSLESVVRHGLQRTTIAEREAGRQEARQRLEEQLAAAEPSTPPSGSDDVAGWIAALAGGPRLEDNVNAPNWGQIPQLPAGAVVETRGVLDGTGCRPLVSPLPAALEAVVRPHVLRQELLVEAAVAGDTGRALAALASDPLLSCPDLAPPMLAELMSATREWLPRSA